MDRDGGIEFKNREAGMDFLAETEDKMDFAVLQRSVALQDWPWVVRLVQELLMGGVLLSEVQQDSVIEALILALEWGDFQVRWDVAKVLPGLGDRAIGPLLEWLQEEDLDEDVQWFGIRMLGRWAGDAGLTQLLEVLQSGTPDLQAMALSALIQQGNAILDRILPLLIANETRLLAVRILSGIRSRDTLDLLLTVVTDEDPEIRTVALEALSSFQDERLGFVFVTAMSDPVTTVRQTAAMAMGFCQTLSELDRTVHLVPLLWDVQISVCCAAASSLGRINHEDSIAALQKALFSQPLPTSLGLELSRSLFHIGNTIGYEDAIVGLGAYVMTGTNFSNQNRSSSTSGLDINLDVVSEIIQILGRVETPIAKPIVLYTVLKCLEQQPINAIDRTLAITTLGHLKDPRSIDPLIRQLIHPSPSLRLHILHALQQIDPFAALDRLQSQLSESQHSNSSSTPSPSTLSNNALQNGIHFVLTEWRN